jgi:hypothetical protein
VFYYEATVDVQCGDWEVGRGWKKDAVRRGCAGKQLSRTTASVDSINGGAEMY